MVNINNELSNQSPVPESVLEEEALKAFTPNRSDIPSAIQAYLTALSAIPEFQNYKLVVNASVVDGATRGPVQTYTGAFWNAQKDGSWSTHLGSLDIFVTITWIHA